MPDRGETICTRGVAAISRFANWVDRLFVDGLVNLTARWTCAVGARLRRVQTGNLRQYVMLLAAGTVVLFVLMSLFRDIPSAGR